MFPMAFAITMFKGIIRTAMTTPARQDIPTCNENKCQIIPDITFREIFLLPVDTKETKSRQIEKVDSKRHVSSG